MIMQKMKYLLSLLMLAVALQALPQGKRASLEVPFGFELFLSGNFGELRSNHFHSGVDFKTQGAVGRPVTCVADGYISRASIQPGGYGLALYVTHDNGYMTVYGHLDRFPAAVAKRLRNKQYKDETFAVDMAFSPDEFKVKRGEVLAYAGNTGYSFGPHLHFEIRDKAGNELYDPMKFYKQSLKDSRAPVAYKVGIYPRLGEGVLDGGDRSKLYNVKGNTISAVPEVWGKIGFGIKADDLMDGTNNKYGVCKIELLVDGVERFSSTMDNFSFEETRLINAWADYARYAESGEWVLRSHILDNNPLRALSADENNGWVTIDEERVYDVEYRLSDYHGNCSVYKFKVQGKKSAMIAPEDGHFLYWFMNNAIEREAVRLEIPMGELFENTLLDVKEEKGKSGLSPVYSFSKSAVPFWHGAKLSIKVPDGAGVDSDKIYIRKVTKKGGSSVGGKYSNGWVTATVGALGRFELAADTVAPKLQPVGEKNWMKRGKIVFAVADKETHIKSFRGTLNGNFVLFNYSSKNSRLELDLKRENIRRGSHLLELEVEDACGNRRVFRKNIKY